MNKSRIPMESITSFARFMRMFFLLVVSVCFFTTHPYCDVTEDTSTTPDEFATYEPIWLDAARFGQDLFVQRMGSVRVLAIPSFANVPTISSPTDDWLTANAWIRTPTALWKSTVVLGVTSWLRIQEVGPDGLDFVAHSEIIPPASIDGRILSASTWVPLPTIADASISMSMLVGDMIYGATPASATEYFWYYLDPKSTTDTITPDAEWRQLGQSDLLVTQVIEFNPVGALMEPLDEGSALSDGLGSREKVTGVREYELPFRAVSSGLRNEMNAVFIGFGEHLSPEDYSAWTQRANYSEMIGNASDTTFTITHSQNSRVIVQAAESEGYHRVIDPTIKYVDADNISVTFSTPPAANAYTVNILAASNTLVLGDGVSEDFTVTTSTDTRNVYFQVYENGGNNRLIDTGLVYDTVDSATISIFPIATSNEYIAIWVPFGAETSNFFELFVALDGSNRGAMEGYHGNSTITFEANKFIGDGYDLTNIRARYMQEELISTLSPVHGYHWFYDAGIGQWVPVIPANAWFQIHFDGQLVQPDTSVASLHLNTQDVLEWTVDATTNTATLGIDVDLLESYLKVSGSNAMEGNLNLDGNDLINGGLIYGTGYLADGLIGQTATTLQMVKDITVGSATQVFANYFDFGFRDGLMVKNTTPTGETLLGSFLPFDDSFYSILQNDPGLDLYYLLDGSRALTGDMDAAGKDINNVSGLRIRQDGRLLAPEYIGDSTAEFYDFLGEERAEGYWINDAAGVYRAGFRYQNKLWMHDMVTEEEAKASEEAEVHFKGYRGTGQVAARMIAAVTRYTP